jgi:hypothetical protein
MQGLSHGENKSRTPIELQEVGTSYLVKSASIAVTITGFAFCRSNHCALQTGLKQRMSAQPQWGGLRHCST